ESLLRGAPVGKPVGQLAHQPDRLIADAPDRGNGVRRQDGKRGIHGQPEGNSRRAVAKLESRPEQALREEEDALQSAERVYRQANALRAKKRNRESVERRVEDEQHPNLQESLTLAREQTRVHVRLFTFDEKIGHTKREYPFGSPTFRRVGTDFIAAVRRWGRSSNPPHPASSRRSLER